MYVNPFAMGVCATIFAETLLFTVYIASVLIRNAYKNNKK